VRGNVHPTIVAHKLSHLCSRSAKLSDGKPAGTELGQVGEIGGQWCRAVEEEA
jgi:hypothetical protein